MKYTSSAISDPKKLTFGRGLEIGGGMVYPELNFTLPPMSIKPETRGEVVDHYLPDLQCE